MLNPMPFQFNLSLAECSRLFRLLAGAKLDGDVVVDYFHLDGSEVTFVIHPNPEAPSNNMEAFKIILGTLGYSLDRGSKVWVCNTCGCEHRRESKPNYACGFAGCFSLNYWQKIKLVRQQK